MANCSHPETTVAASAATTLAVRVRDFNDALRRTFTGGRIVVTAGVAALPEAARAVILLAVRSFSAFDPNNDPHGEHDFGAVEVGLVRVFWKIDAYDRDLRFGSPDPADPTVTGAGPHHHARRGVLRWPGAS